MRIARFGCVGVLVTLALALPACSSTEHPADSPRGATNMQPSPPTVQDQGWAALVEADREVNRLAEVRDQTPDVGARNDISLEMMELRARSDRLLDDMSIGDGRVHDAAIRADVSNLHRIMHADAVTEMQGEPPRR